MTVASQLKTVVASLKSAQASFEQFALNTQNQQAKTTFTNAAQQTQTSLTRSFRGCNKLNKKNRSIKGSKKSHAGLSAWLQLFSSFI